MSLAPDWIELEKWEDYFESAAKAILAAQSINAYITRTDETRATPCVAIEFTLGAQERHAGQRASDGEYFYDVYKATLSYTIATDRATNDDQDAANTDSHATIRAKCRWLMRDISLWSLVLLPYHQVTEIIPTGTSPQISDEQDWDISQLDFSMLVAVRADAWPAD